MAEDKRSMLISGEKVAAARKAAGLTQQQLADRTSMAVSSIRRIEGLPSVSVFIGTAHAIASAVGAKPAAISAAEEAESDKPADLSDISEIERLSAAALASADQLEKDYHEQASLDSTMFPPIWTLVIEELQSYRRRRVFSLRSSAVAVDAWLALPSDQQFRDEVIRIIRPMVTELRRDAAIQPPDLSNRALSLLGQREGEELVFFADAKVPRPNPDEYESLDKTAKERLAARLQQTMTLDAARRKPRDTQPTSPSKGARRITEPDAIAETTADSDPASKPASEASLTSVRRGKVSQKTIDPAS